MRHLKLKNIGCIALAAVFCFLIAAGCVTTRKTPPPPPPTAQAPVRLKPGPNDGHIAYWTARFLEEYHYSQQLLDTRMAVKIFCNRTSPNSRISGPISTRSRLAATTPPT